jgi:hypothetical protein
LPHLGGQRMGHCSAVMVFQVSSSREHPQYTTFLCVHQCSSSIGTDCK